MVPRTVLTRPGPISLNTARPVNTIQLRTTVNNAGPMKNVITNAYSTARRPFNKTTATNNSNLNKKKLKLLRGNPQQDLKDKGVIDSGCSRYMTGNISYLTYYEDIDGGFISFGGNSKRGKITGKDFKLTNESHVFLKVYRKDNVYSVDLKNVVPQGDLRVKVIRCDNVTEFKNRVMNQFYEMKGIKREFSIARTPQQNRVAKRKNKTPIEAAKTMLADSKLPITFWAEAVNTACYVQNRVLVIKPHNNSPYELFLGGKHALSFMRPFGCPITILNTIDNLGKFDGKANKGFFVGCSTNSKAFKVFNNRTRIVEENPHVKFSEDTPNIAGSGPNWLFDIDALTKSKNYEPVVAGNQSNGNADTKACDDAGEEEKKDDEDPRNEDNEVLSTEEPRVNQEKENEVNSTNNINTVSLHVNVAGIEDNTVDENIVYGCEDDPNMPNLEEIVYSDNDEGIGAEADMTNLDTNIPDRSNAGCAFLVNAEGLGLWLSYPLWQEGHWNKMGLQEQERGKRGILNFETWSKAGCTGLHSKRRIDYDEVFAPVARIEAIRLFLAYASFKNFIVYQMDVKSAFLYGKIKEEVYVCQPPGFEDL
ncbi:retrovirus-related pol polyprotein from transposon TNT 1-94 [Tanacetum coccineum]